MRQTVYKCLADKLIDWLIAFCVSCLFLWFVVTQPVLNRTLVNIDIPIVSSQNLKDHVLLLTDGYSPRSINYDNLNHTADYIYQQFSLIGVPEYQHVNTISQQYRNVSLQLGPDSEEIYVIGAHYDAKDDSIDSEGNASGVATLIELARHLSASNSKLGIGVILVAYPLSSLNQADNIVDTGSFFHARSLKKDNKQVKLMISLDGVGRTKSDKIKTRHQFKFMDLLYPDKVDTLNLVGRLKDFNSIRDLKKAFNNSSNLSLYSHNLPESFNRSHSSDHVNYWRQGYPAALISDALYGDDSSNDLSKMDLSDRFDYEKMSSLVTGLYQVIVDTDASINNEEKTQLAQRARNNKSKSALY